MLKVNDIFESISGEAGGFPQGTWATFIRLQGCNLRCRWCDTPQAQDPNGLSFEMNVPAVLKMVRCKHVLITGGEPLLQEETPELINELLELGFVVQVETNGSMNIPFRIPGVYWVIDRKGPSSCMSAKMIAISPFCHQIEQIYRHGSKVCLKWVISTNDDIDFAIREMKEVSTLLFLQGYIPPPFIASPVNADEGKIASIVERIKEHNRSLLDNIIFSIQLHKICGMP